MIISVFLLTAWAILQVLSKESPPTPMKTQPGGARPGGLPPAPRLPDRGPARSAQAGGSFRNAEPSDEIIILSAETLRHPAPVTPRAGGGARPRTTKRPKSSSQGASGAREEIARTKTLGGSVTQNLVQTLEKSEPLLPLAIGTSPLLAMSSESARPSVQVEPVPPPVDLATALGSQSRVREALILNELLQPPLALRNRRR